jgi:hypothetical protein
VFLDVTELFDDRAFHLANIIPSVWRALGPSVSVGTSGRAILSRSSSNDS